jgi:hypothetical protein
MSQFHLAADRQGVHTNKTGNPEMVNHPHTTSEQLSGRGRGGARLAPAAASLVNAALLLDDHVLLLLTDDDRLTGLGANDVRHLEFGGILSGNSCPCQFGNTHKQKRSSLHAVDKKRPIGNRHDSGKQVQYMQKNDSNGPQTRKKKRVRIPMTEPGWKNSAQQIAPRALDVAAVQQQQKRVCRQLRKHQRASSRAARRTSRFTTRRTTRSVGIVLFVLTPFLGYTPVWYFLCAD